MHSELYEDDGDGLAHRLGDYLLHRFTYSSAVKELSICHRTEGDLTRRKDAFELALHALPHTAAPVATADGVVLDGAFDNKHVYRVQLPAAFRSLCVKF